MWGGLQHVFSGPCPRPADDGNVILEASEAVTRIGKGVDRQAMQCQRAVALKMERPSIGPPWQSMARHESCRVKLFDAPVARQLL